MNRCNPVRSHSRNYVCWIVLVAIPAFVGMQCGLKTVVFDYAKIDSSGAGDAGKSEEGFKKIPVVESDFLDVFPRFNLATSGDLEKLPTLTDTRLRMIFIDGIGGRSQRIARTKVQFGIENRSTHAMRIDSRSFTFCTSLDGERLQPSFVRIEKPPFHTEKLTVDDMDQNPIELEAGKSVIFEMNFEARMARNKAFMFVNVGWPSENARSSYVVRASLRKW